MTINIEDQAIIIKVSKFQESSLIIDCFTKEHGLLKGLIKSSKQANELIPMNLVHVNYRNRIETQLGYLKLEVIRNYFSLLGFNRLKLKLANALLSVVSSLLTEGDQHRKLYDEINQFFENLYSHDDILINLKNYALLELIILSEIGYGLDLSQCVVTNSNEDLAYISPKSGCAVSLKASIGYENKLFKMPPFYQNSSVQAKKDEIMNALNINKFFFIKNIYSPDGTHIPFERESLNDYFNQHLVN